jgi:hypothetical protein
MMIMLSSLNVFLDNIIAYIMRLFYLNDLTIHK